MSGTFTEIDTAEMEEAVYTAALGDEDNGESEDLLKNVNLCCSVCLSLGVPVNSKDCTDEEGLWNIHDSCNDLAERDELCSKIMTQYPDVPKARLENPTSTVCSSCLTTVKGVLHAKRQSLGREAKNNRAMSTMEAKELSSRDKRQGLKPRKSRRTPHSAGVIHTRAKRKCALTGLSQEIINAELGYDLNDVVYPSETLRTRPKRNSVKMAEESKEKSKAGGRSKTKVKLGVRSCTKGLLDEDNSDIIDAKGNSSPSAILVKTVKRKRQTKYKTSRAKDTTSSSGVGSSGEGTIFSDSKKNLKTLAAKEKFFCCPKCCQYFPPDKYVKFKSHLSEECFVKKRIPCQLCGHIYSTQTVLDCHMINVHEKPHPNSKIMRTMPRKEYVATVNKIVKMREEGMSTTELENDSLSKICKELDQDEWPEDEAEAEKMASSHGIWKCWICFYESKQKALWNTHMNRIHPDVVGISLSCSTCGFSFWKKFQLREHNHEVHGDNSSYTCKDCGRRYLHKNIQHLCEKIQCNICGKTFTTRGLRSKHMLVHPEFRPFKCKLCPKEFQRREYLTIHMRVHNDIRPYGCEFCDKSFRSKTHYNNHRRLHTGEKPYVCHTCGRAFVSPQCLYNHLMSHNGKKSAVCTTCSKAFRSKNDLKRHEYIHSGVKPFSCKYCAKSFNRRGNCSVHERAHELDGEFQCDLCNLKFEKENKLQMHKHKFHGPPKSKTKMKQLKSYLTAPVITPIPEDVIQVYESEVIPHTVTLIHVEEDVASNVEISEGILTEPVDEPISLYQFSFEIDENTLYCIQDTTK